MEILVEKTIEEISVVFEKALLEAYEAGVIVGRVNAPQVADEPSGPESIEYGSLNLQKVNKKVSAGDYVRFHDTHSGRLIDGKVYGPVKRTMTVGDNNYNVFNAVHNRKPDNVEVFEVIESHPVIELQDPPTPNQQRYETIQRAKKFVEGRREADGYINNRNGDGREVEFIVNDKKRTVVAISRGPYTNAIYGRGVAKCNPNDVFNADIGKAIALARALGIEVPEEFLKAVQPDEVVVGMRVVYLDEMSRGIMTVIDYSDNRTYPTNETKISVANDLNTHIIDDTNAEYGGGEG